MVQVKEPTSEFQSLFFHENLLSAKAYSLDPEAGSIKLDQNESPFDWDESLKREVLEKLVSEPWNTYPQDYPRELKKLLAEYNGVSPENVVLSPGSNYHITVLLSLFSAKGGNELVLTRPSFPLFEGHCRYHNIPYKVWPLNDSLEYDLSLMPNLSPGSVVFFASPNNPVGNVLDSSSLVLLLEKHPDCYFVADEAYWEFLEENNAQLLEKYSNLIILRTFSKAMSSAGVRLSYVLASRSFCEQLTKVTLPFLINKFTVAAATCALQKADYKEKIWSEVRFMKEERNRIFDLISDHLADKAEVSIFNSHANFVSMKFESESLLKKCEEILMGDGVIARNISNPILGYTLRISVGLKQENSKFISCIVEKLF